MQFMKSNSIKWVYSVLVAVIFTWAAYGCGGGSQKQMGGIVGEMSFSTQACVPQQKIINIRNDDTKNPQRVMGVYFELGTNAKSYFSIDKVVVGGTEYQASANLSQDVLIPAGGIMSVYTTYNPQKVTSAGNDTSYLDLFLNGPKLGILQIKTTGDAPTAKEGCGAGQKRTFTVNKATLQISMQGSAFDGYNEEVQTAGDFAFLVDGEQATINGTDGFPTLTVHLPTPVSGITDIKISLDAKTATGIFKDNKLSFDDLTLQIMSSIPVQHVKLTTDSLPITGDHGTLPLQGANLTDTGDMKVVLGTGVQDTGTLSALNGAAVGVTLELTEKK